jgi:quercetin dioxygenase-like cupin family protein
MKFVFYTVCLALLLTNPAWALDTNPVKVEVLAKASASWDGATLPKYRKGQPEVTILKITIPPKARLPLHTHAVINAGYLLKGELTVVTEDDKTLQLKAGDSIVEVVKTKHNGRNNGDEPAVIIVFYAGVQGTPITTKVAPGPK